MNIRRLVSLFVALVLASTLLAYFGRPKPPLLEFVSARQELADLSERLPGSTALADRVTRSYGLALILVQSPYAASNAIALESLRMWAADRFQREPGFLHPISLPAGTAANQTLFGSFFYNLGSYAYFALQDVIGHALQAQIAHFHGSSAYNTFASAYFDLFGADADSAALLAAYQCERARLAVDVIAWAILWAAAIAAGCIFVLAGKPGTRFTRLQRALCAEWLLLSLSYLLLAFTGNSTSMLVSAAVAGIFGLYLRHPFVLSPQESSRLSISPISLASKWIALVLWLSFSLAAIQVLTWIRTGSLSNPDPVTLCLSALSGNFLHDPSHGKRIIMRAIGIFWIALSFWTIRQSRRDAAAARDAEAALASLKGPFTL